MRKLSFYPRLAARSIKSNRQFYLPYLLTVIGACAAMYILYALFFDPGFDRLGEGTMNGQVYTQMFMSIGITLVTLFCFVFLIPVTVLFFIKQFNGQTFQTRMRSLKHPPVFFQLRNEFLVTGFQKQLLLDRIIYGIFHKPEPYRYISAVFYI